MTPAEFRAIRLASVMTQAELAAWLRVDLRTIQKWEGGERKIPGPVQLLMEQQKQDRQGEGP
jgi:DNA-binding transcriptional regulator YiaG